MKEGGCGGVPARRRPLVVYLQLRVLHLSSGRGHLVLQEGQLRVRGAAADAAGALLQVPQRPLQAVHRAGSQVHLGAEERENPRVTL